MSDHDGVKLDLLGQPPQRAIQRPLKTPDQKHGHNEASPLADETLQQFGVHLQGPPWRGKGPGCQGPVACDSTANYWPVGRPTGRRNIGRVVTDDRPCACDVPGA